MSASWFDPSSWNFDPSSWFSSGSTDSWFNSNPVFPTDTGTTSLLPGMGSDTGGYSLSSQVYPDPGSPTGYSDINGNMVDSTGQPVNYDSNGRLIDSNGNVIGSAGTYQPLPTDTTTTTDANGNLTTTDSNGNTTTTNADGSTTTTDANGNVIARTAASAAGAGAGGAGGTAAKGAAGAAGAGGSGTTTGGGAAAAGGGLLSSLFGGGGSSSGGSSLLGTLGMLAAGAGAGALLSNLLSNKSSSTGTSSAAPAHAAQINQGNLNYTQLAPAGTNPGNVMGQPVAAAQPLPTNLGQIVPPSAIAPINPTNLMTNTGVPNALASPQPIQPTAGSPIAVPFSLTGSQAMPNAPIVATPQGQGFTA